MTAIGSITVIERYVAVNLRFATVDIQFSTNNQSNGDTGFTAAALGWDSIYQVVFDQPAGYAIHYNYSTGAVLVRRSAVHTHALHLNHADVADGATTRVNAGTNLLGANTGADIAVAGVTGTGGAGGIVQAAQIALGENTTADISTTVVSLGTTTNTVRCFVIGR